MRPERSCQERNEVFILQVLEGLKHLRILKIHRQILSLTWISVRVTFAFDVLKSYISVMEYVEGGVEHYGRIIY